MVITSRIIFKHGIVLYYTQNSYNKSNIYLSNSKGIRVYFYTAEEEREEKKQQVADERAFFASRTRYFRRGKGDGNGRKCDGNERTRVAPATLDDDVRQRILTGGRFYHRAIFADLRGMYTCYSRPLRPTNFTSDPYRATLRPMCALHAIMTHAQSYATR